MSAADTTAPSVLIVEDDDTIGLAVEASLSLEGFAAQRVATIAAAREALGEATGAPTLLVLDLGLPDGDGMELCRELRRAGRQLPILMLTARTTLDDRIGGLDAGADDYLAKPFDMAELVARLRALLRRVDWRPEQAQLVVGQLQVDLGTREATSAGEPVTLTQLELELLVYLTARRGSVVGREQLLADVWRVDGSVKTRTVDVFVSRLRKLIEVDPSKPEVLLSIRGAGYRLV